MDELLENMLYQGVSVDVTFDDPKPWFGDLFRICGCSHPLFPPTGEFGFVSLADLQFQQVDDYFGIRSLTDEGTDVPIWLSPIVDGDTVYHHPGPFDGIRLDYCILRNPVHRADHFLLCIERFAVLGSAVVYRSRGNSLGCPPTLSSVRADILAVVQHWALQGIVVGSNEALLIDY